jgi:preprotein translocase subunit SecG
MINVQENVPLYSIFILILILSGGYIIQLVPCKLQRMLDSNNYIKHLFCFLTLLFLIILVDPEESKNKINTILLKTVVLYIFFIFIIKTYYKFFVAIMILLAIKYIIFIHSNSLKDELSKFDDNKDKDKEDINKINNNLNKIIIIQNILFAIIIILIIIGFLVYLGEKKFQYKNKFDFLIFLFGKPNCSNIPEKINISNSLKYAFK